MKTSVLLGLLIPFSLPAADLVLAACMVTSGDWVVGAKLPPSGLMVRVNGRWEGRGYPHPYISAAVADPGDPRTLWLSAGNGAIRTRNGARDWRITTGHTVTELRDVAADPHRAGVIYIGHTDGLAVTRDHGATWHDTTGNRPRRFTETVRVDRAKPGRLLAAGEDGLWLSEDDARTWRPAGAQGFHIMRLEQSPHDPLDWIAVTMHGGPFRSRDGGRTFEPIHHLRIGRYLGVDRNSYDVAFDPNQKGRIALSIWGTGVALTEDDGATWSWRNKGLPRLELWSLAFDPAQPGRLFVSVHEEALYVSDDLGKTWRADGLPGSAVYRLTWLPKESIQ
jgi:photosystem II stability/assembly factor-like uncharacterized protein